MLLRVVSRTARLQQAVLQQASRNFGASAVVLQKSQSKMDPIQKLYLDKLRDYAAKSKSAGGKMVDIDPKTEQNMKDEIEKLGKLFGGGDMTKFPEFQFKEIDFDAPAK